MSFLNIVTSEENLREAASLGDYNGVKKFVEANVNINSQNAMNGWTALHWAAIRGHKQIVQFLLQKGADPTLKDKSNATAYDVAASVAVKGLLCHSSTSADTQIFKPQLPIVPNYLKHPKLISGYSENINQEPRNSKDALSHLQPANSNQFQQKTDTSEKQGLSNQSNLNSNYLRMQAIQNHKQHINSSDSMSNAVTARNKRIYCSNIDDSNSIEACASSPKQEKVDHELVLKVRLSDSVDKDFIEVAMPSSEIGFDAVVKVICEELDVPIQNVVKLKKLPNTIVRNNRDVQRFQNYQELELECSSKDMKNGFSHMQ